MSKNLLNITYKNTQKLIRENFQEINNIFEEKLLNYCVEFTGNSFEKNIEFEGVLNSIIDYDMQIFTSNTANIKIFINDVMIHNADINNNYFINSSCYIKDVNHLVIKCSSSENCLFKFNINLKGNIKNNENILSRLEEFNNNLIFIKNNLLSQNNDLLTITNNINNYNTYNYDKIYDVNFLYNNSNLLKNNLIKIYNKSNHTYLNNVTNNKEIVLNDADDYCILPSDNDKYNVLFVKNGRVYICIYNVNMELELSSELTQLNHLNISKIKSISSDQLLNYFWIKTKNNSWYLCEINISSLTITAIKNYTNCMDVSSYFFDNKLYVFNLLVNGVKLDIFDSMNMSTKLQVREFKNSNDAFYYDGKIYLLNGEVVQEVE